MHGPLEQFVLNNMHNGLFAFDKLRILKPKWIHDTLVVQMLEFTHLGGLQRLSKQLFRLLVSIIWWKTQILNLHGVIELHFSFFPLFIGVYNRWKALNLRFLRMWLLFLISRISLFRRLVTSETSQTLSIVKFIWVARAYIYRHYMVVFIRL